MTGIEKIEINTGENPQHCVIWLHGLGADGHDFEPIVPQLDLPNNKAIRFVFPHAPVRPVTLNNNFPMRAWYDIYGLTIDTKEDEAGIREACELLGKLIEVEHQRGIPYENIFVAGFSQGGAIALYTGVTFPKKLAGIIALSTYIPLNQKARQERAEENRNIPIFMAHGKQDQIVPFEWGFATKEGLKNEHYAVTWHEYLMAHSVCLQEIKDIGNWLGNIILASPRVN